MSGSFIFDWYGIRNQQGAYVPFIVWTNFIAGFLYLLAVYGFFKAMNWTYWVLIGITILLIFAAIALMIYINQDGIFEIKTIGAMNFRIILTLVFSVLAYYKIRKH